MNLNQMPSILDSLPLNRAQRALALLLLIAGVLTALPARAQMSLSISPAVIMAKGTLGQSLTQRLTINNQTSNVYRFEMIAEDIVVRDGKRVFLPAGEAPNSIAATAVFSPKELIASPNSSNSVTVTVTLPPATTIRAIAAVFHATSSVDPKTGSLGLVASMGTLITFNLSNNVAISGGDVQIALPTDTTNLAFTQELTNTGAEPVLPTGVAAILNDQNRLVGKASFAVQRLLPGEKLSYKAEYADLLKPGHYHALCTFQYDGQTETKQVEFSIP